MILARVDQVLSLSLATSFDEFNLISQINLTLYKLDRIAWHSNAKIDNEYFLNIGLYHSCEYSD